MSENYWGGNFKFDNSQEYGLLTRDFRERGGARRSNHERLTETQRQELRQMRKRQKMEHRKRKIIKLDDEGVRARVGEG